MGLGMPSLKCLAYRVVLLQNLDTRDLPLRLHMEMQQYRKLRGAFKILSIKWKVERLDGGQLTPEDKELAFRCVFDNCAAYALTRTPYVYNVFDQNMWRMTRADKELYTEPVAVEQEDATFQLPERDQLLHTAFAWPRPRNITATQDITLQTASFTLWKRRSELS